MKDKISKYIDDNKNWLIDNLIDLLSIDTINRPPNGNENNGQDFLEKIFRNIGLEIDRFSPDDVPEFRNSELNLNNRNFDNRDNLVGIIGQGKKQTIIFNGHVDTVPTDFDKWTKTEALKGKLIGDKIYGLGSNDMKGGLVATIFALKSVIDLGIEIQGKVLIESVVDEEFYGSNGTIACVLKGYTGDFAIIPEPSFMDIVTADVSMRHFEFEITSDKSGMEFYDENRGQWDNPIFIAQDIIRALKDYENYLNEQKVNHPLFKDVHKPINFIFSDIYAGNIERNGIIRTPSTCLLRVATMNYPEIRTMEEYNDCLISYLKENHKEIYNYIKNGNVTIDNDYWRMLEAGVLDLESPQNKDFVNSIKINAAEVTKRDLETGLFLAGCDMFAFTNYGNTGAVVLGPRGGNTHSPDEWVYLKDLVDLSKIYASIIYDYCC